MATNEQLNLRNELRQAREQSSFKRIIIIGAGGVGFYVAAALAKERLKQEILVFDGDDLKGGNGHERLPKANPTTYKVELLRGFVRMVLGEMPPTIYPYKFELDEMDDLRVNESDLLVDCTDMATKNRQVIWKEAQARGAKMLRVSYDGNGVVVLATGLPIEFGENVPGGYELVPNFAQSLRAGGSGAEFVLRVLEGVEVETTQMQI